MATLSSTSNATAQGASAIIILSWWLSGHPLVNGQIPLDVAAVLTAWLGLAGHAVEQLGEQIVALWVKKHAPELEPLIPTPPQGTQV